MCVYCFVRNFTLYYLFVGCENDEGDCEVKVEWLISKHLNISKSPLEELLFTLFLLVFFTLEQRARQEISVDCSRKRFVATIVLTTHCGRSWNQEWLLSCLSHAALDLLENERLHFVFKYFNNHHFFYFQRLLKTFGLENLTFKKSKR